HHQERPAPHQARAGRASAQPPGVRAVTIAGTIDRREPSPAPWRAVPSVGFTVILAGDDATVGTVSDGPDGAANARLTAAAPELLVALEALCERFDAATAARDYGHDLWSAALAVVSKARGQSA